MNECQLKPIKDRHKQLIKQYVQSKRETFEEEDYDKLFDYISDAYNYKRPLVLDIYPDGNAPSPILKMDGNGEIVYNSSDTGDSEVLTNVVLREGGIYHFTLMKNQ